MNPIVVAAVIAKDQSELDTSLTKLRGHVNRVQLDYMDGKFVESHSLDFTFNLPTYFEYEAHLMVESPMKWIEKLPASIKTVIVHVETFGVAEAIKRVKGRNNEVFLALNPSTSVEALKPFLGLIDGVMVMAVEPGKYGAVFIPYTLEKVKELRRNNKELVIEVDGGMNPTTAREARIMGADIIVSGSYIVKSSNVSMVVSELRKSITQNM